MQILYHKYIHCGNQQPLQSHKPDPFPQKKGKWVWLVRLYRVAIGHNVKYQVPCFHSSAFCSHSCPALYHIEVAFCKIWCLYPVEIIPVVLCMANLPTRSTPTKSTSHAWVKLSPDELTPQGQLSINIRNVTGSESMRESQLYTL